MLDTQAIAEDGSRLDIDTIEQTLKQGLEGKFANQDILVIIPDHTRSIPLPMLFHMLADILDDVNRLDFMVALGTHPPLSEERLMELVGITYEERNGTYRHIGLYNHEWDNEDALIKIGKIKKKHIREYMGDLWHESLDHSVPVTINRKIEDYDRMLILSPVFPHEVVGFSGGAKYLFPGISGQEIINTTHWMGALAGVMGTIGIKDTPPRRMLHQAATMVETPITLISMVVEKDELAGLFIGDIIEAWEHAVDLSSKRHIVWLDKPFKTILAQAPPMYDELWTAGKAVYKLESAVADGGEIIVYSPTLRDISVVHEQYIEQLGYHVRDYFLGQWEQFKQYPLGIVAHSTHVRGTGTFVDGVEYPRMGVTLATGLSKETVENLALKYMDPDSINIADYENREDEGILYVPKAGEILYKVRK
jgi:nickel-dependent lactate racemase